MQQRRFTSRDFVPEGETGEPDAVLDDNDPIHKLKELAGLKQSASVSEPDNDDGSFGAKMSGYASNLHQIERDKGIKPGTPEWFRLWFARPLLTGEKPTD